ncbi:MaoC/PaaZ C-terminal domain-containing protein [uncultured Corynebacterium sp.]|uniref:MaoC/PaaZ C-terminal domain-containing protein n=1 Tax=uncultured Corynebacterium sp. TaxID=159447 RepID=UPI0025DF14CC|nr:MaoC/PaaZ C-terminal domain-containing protein [uncultured Corynebacterium sp.]
MNLVELDSIPELAALYRGQVTHLASKRTRVDDPTTGYAVRGLRPDVSRLAAYCQATGLRLGNQLPVTYPYVLGFPLAIKTMDHPEFPFKPMGAVHISNTITQRRPLTVDDALDIEVYADNVRPHRKGLLIDMHTRVLTAGEPAWEQTSTFLSTGARFTSATPEAVAARPEDTGRVLPGPNEAASAPSRTAAHLRFDRPGTSAYAEASGDKNPIHVSVAGAKLFGFPAPIAHGMYSLARMVAFEEGRLPAAVRLETDFYKPILLPAKTTLVDAGDGRRILRRNAEKVHVIAQVSAAS